MTPAAEFTRSMGIAAAAFPDFPGMSFNFAGKPVRFGSVKEIGPKDVEVYLSMLDLRKPELVTVMGLICFLADVRGVNLILDFVVPDDPGLLKQVETMLGVNGFSPCGRSDGEKFISWCRLARSVAA